MTLDVAANSYSPSSKRPNMKFESWIGFWGIEYHYHTVPSLLQILKASLCTDSTLSVSFSLQMYMHVDLSQLFFEKRAGQGSIQDLW